jgi:hypothetical protein
MFNIEMQELYKRSFYVIAEVRFQPNAGGQWNPNDFREFAAMHLSKEFETVFWYKDGKPIQGTPEVCFVGSKDWVGMRAYTNKGCADMFTAAIQLAEKLDDFFPGKPHAVKIQQFSDDAVNVEKGARYHISRFALPLSLTKGMDYASLLPMMPARGSTSAPMNEEWQEKIKHSIVSSLKEQLPALKNKHVVADFTNGANWGTPVSKKTNDGKSMLNFMARNLTISLNVMIHRPIQVGTLRSRGYGDLKRIV